MVQQDNGDYVFPAKTLREFPVETIRERYAFGRCDGKCGNGKRGNREWGNREWGNGVMRKGKGLAFA
jgi:hypothetical protein